MGLSDEQHSSLQVLHAERHLEVQQLRGQEVDFRLTHTEICSIERKLRFIHIFDKRIKNSKGLCKVKKKRRNKMIKQESFNINIKKLVSDGMDQAAMLFFLYLCLCLFCFIILEPEWLIFGKFAGVLTYQLRITGKTDYLSDKNDF